MDIHLKGGDNMDYKMYCFRIADEMKKQLKKEAHEKGLTLSVYIRKILAKRNKNEIW